MMIEELNKLDELLANGAERAVLMPYGRIFYATIQHLGYYHN